MSALEDLQLSAHTQRFAIHYRSFAESMDRVLPAGPEKAAAMAKLEEFKESVFLLFLKADPNPNPAPDLPKAMASDQ